MKQRKKAKAQRQRSEGRKMEIYTRTVENPYFSRDHRESRSNPRLISAIANARESGIAMLAAKGALDPAQTAAADRYRQLFERMGGAGAGAIDYGREHVDGGYIADPIKPLQLEAGRELERARTTLVKAHGEYGYRLVSYIAGQGYSVHDLTATRRQRDTMTDLLRLCLDCLAELWGYSAKVRAPSSSKY